MFIKVDHQEYRGIELVGESILIHSMHGDSRTLQEQVKDVAVSVQNGILHIVAFLEQDYAWFYTGSKTLERERIELGQVYGGGGRLIADGVGNSHLFYFVKQSPGHSVLLRHQTYSDKWSSPMLVSTNVFAQATSFSVAWHHDNYLHIAYCNHRDQRLLYRVFNLEHRTWSGAVPFSDQRCSYPQFIAGEKLYLFWQEDGPKISLKVRHKDQSWSPTTQISTQENHAASVGYSFQNECWHVLWSEGSEFFKSPFNKWAERSLVERDDYGYAWVIRDGILLPMYEVMVQTPAPTPTPTPTPIPVQSLAQVSVPAADPEIKVKKEEVEPRPQPSRRDNEEAKAQAAFVEQAFRTLQEWETLKEEIRQWQARFTPPEVVDLTPLTTRCDRLERRLFNLQQSQEQNKQNWESRFEQVQLELGRTHRRLTVVEDWGKKRQVSLWRRVLRRS